MSDDERSKKRKEHDEEPDVEAHIFDDDLGEPDPEKKRKRGEFDVEDGEDTELGRKRK